jgi:hypothetical protein
LEPHAGTVTAHNTAATAKANFDVLMISFLFLLLGYFSRFRANARADAQDIGVKNLLFEG